MNVVLYACLLSLSTLTQNSTADCLPIHPPVEQEVSTKPMPPTDEDVFYIDTENLKVYIDFAGIAGEKQWLLVKTSDGKTVLEEDLTFVPNDDFHEVDFLMFERGSYLIEILSSEHTVSKSFEFR